MPENNQIRSYAKGRNGYFDIKSIHVEAGREAQAGSVWIHFFSRSAVWPGPCYAVLKLEDAKLLQDKLTAALQKVSEVKV